MPEDELELELAAEPEWLRMADPNIMVDSTLNTNLLIIFRNKII